MRSAPVPGLRQQLCPALQSPLQIDDLSGRASAHRLTPCGQFAHRNGSAKVAKTKGAREKPASGSSCAGINQPGRAGEKSVIAGSAGRRLFDQ